MAADRVPPEASRRTCAVSRPTARTESVTASSRSSAEAVRRVTITRYAVVAVPTQPATVCSRTHQAAALATPVARAPARTAAHSGGSRPEHHVQGAEGQHRGGQGRDAPRRQRPVLVANLTEKQYQGRGDAEAHEPVGPRGDPGVPADQGQVGRRASVRHLPGEHVPGRVHQHRAEPEAPRVRRAPRPPGPRPAEPRRRSRRGRAARRHRSRGRASRIPGSAAPRPAARGGAARARPRQDERRSGTDRTWTATAAKRAAASSGQPRRSDHQAPRPTCSRARSQPVRRSTTQLTRPIPPTPYAVTGSSRRRATNSTASNGTATVHATAGFAANQALVEQTSRTPSAATDLGAVQPADRLALCPEPDDQSRHEQGHPDESAGAAPVECIETGQPGRLCPEQVDGEHPEDDQPQGLGRSAERPAGDRDRGQREQAGDAEQDQGASGEPQDAPRDGHEDGRGDEQAEGAQREQHDRHGRGGQQLRARRPGVATRERRQADARGRRRCSGQCGCGDPARERAQLLDDPVGGDHALPQLGGEGPGDLEAAGRAGGRRIQQCAAVGAQGGVDESAHVDDRRVGAAPTASGARLNSR